MSRLVGTLKRRGLVTRRRLKGNGRTVEINLTAKGKAFTEDLVPIAMHFENVAVRDRTAEEVAWIKRALIRTYERLNEIEAEVATLSKPAKGWHWRAAKSRRASAAWPARNARTASSRRPST